MAYLLSLITYNLHKNKHCKKCFLIETPDIKEYNGTKQICIFINKKVMSNRKNIRKKLDMPYQKSV